MKEEDKVEEEENKNKLEKNQTTKGSKLKNYSQVWLKTTGRCLLKGRATVIYS